MPTALVTGASGGIGLEISRVLRKRGYELALVARSADRLDQVAAELGGAVPVVADLSDPAGVFEVTAKVPDVDVLVNNAGFGMFGPFAESDAGRTAAMVRLNVEAPTALCRHYLPGMLARRSGRVLNVASTAGFQPGPLMAAYYASKAYVLSLTEALAEETRGSGVTCTALCPGVTASGFQKAAEVEDSKLVAGKRLAPASEVAEYGVRAMERGTVVAIPGANNKVLAFSVRVSPRAAVRRVVHKMQEPRTSVSA
jgi:short-subunit dehydrogenase